MRQTAIRPSAYLRGDTLGLKLKKLNLLKDVCLSPRLDAIVVSRIAPSRTDFDNAILESVLFTLKTYSMVNVDNIYLDRLAPLLSKFFDDKVPEGRIGYKKSLFYKFNNAKKTGAKVHSPINALRALHARTRCCSQCLRLSF